MLKKRDFERRGSQVGETKKIEEKSDLHSLSSLNGEMEDVILVNNATLYMNVTRHNVAVWWVSCTKNYSPPSGNEEYYTIAPQRERCTLEHCGSHISQQVVYIEDPNKTNNTSTLGVSVFILLQ